MFRTVKILIKEIVITEKCLDFEDSFIISAHPETRFFGQGQGTRRLQPQEYIEVFRGLQSECDAEIVQKGRFWMGTIL